jgi:hypothetical protein
VRSRVSHRRGRSKPLPAYAVIHEEGPSMARCPLRVRLAAV